MSPVVLGSVCGHGGGEGDGVAAEETRLRGENDCIFYIFSS